MINRFSSRREPMDATFLNKRLEGARKYDRIAGYFSSSILEVAGEALDSVEGTVRVVCNSQLEPEDVKTARAALAAIRKEWCAEEPEKIGDEARGRFLKLYQYLKSGKLQVRVLPDKAFGLIHGKAGVITKADGTKTAFMGSTNETLSAWKRNYELVWEDDSDDAINWVQEEFDALWNHPDYKVLAEFIIEDIGRIAKREVIPSIVEWQKQPEPASAIVESPVYRKEFGLWEHQKYFIDLAFKAHQTEHGARFVLADMVGLGKTLQLAMTAQLIALTGDKPILILTPATLRWQWQDEMKEHLDLPSAVWDNGRWVDEEGIEYPKYGDEGILKCPRRIGVLSYGLITHSYGNERSTIPDLLCSKKYDCIIVDESHRARRKNLGPTHENEKAEPNNLLAFLQDIAGNTKSMLLATATPVQLYPIEAYDLLSILGGGKNESVLGNKFSKWRTESFESLNIIQGNITNNDAENDLFKWIANPFPPASEGIDYSILRRSLSVEDSVAVVPPSRWLDLSPSDRSRLERMKNDFFQKHNPYIRHIVRRTRDFLENEKNPETGEPYLQKIEVKLFGEDDKDAIPLPIYLQDAYKAAEEFCQLLGERAKGTGFLKTLLLRRVGSTLYAGKITASKMLGIREDSDLDSEEEEDVQRSELFENMSEAERSLLLSFVRIIDEHMDNDPKYEKVVEILKSDRWIDRGCIIFSQYYDSIQWLADKLKEELVDEKIGIYAGSNRSGIVEDGIFRRASREEIKSLVRKGSIKLLLGTDAASEGLNLQTLGTLINLDLPWNPTRLEQRKGRIQRIGQVYDDVWIYNMRYKGSVEDRVHELLSDRLEKINSLFGQIPDVLEDVWVDVALNMIDDAMKTIDAIPPRHPFEMRYDVIQPVDWESCAQVLDNHEKKQHLLKGW
ncbi:phospholipase D-like domain-containing anti-phage protein [Methanolobus bombayensis]|uniref:phospholipase D-like domain-containing anti-phage protein n=1 Tax=Methanolobus bombayensis TaxID=38023 RepID=UPI001AE268E4|nr:phospholipase D-like domain-containing anti-phage protein [Methanolobus bombayensis]MBP1909181.1 superfamily II DNA or RNA helicase [Methanolobus bombayensis]